MSSAGDRITIKMVYDQVQTLSEHFTETMIRRDKELKDWVIELKGVADKAYARQDEEISQHRKAIYGNGVPGLKTQMFVVWGILVGMIGLLMSLIVAFIGFIGAVVWGLATGSIQITVR